MEHVEALRVELGLQNRDSSREAVSAFLVACRGLLQRGGRYLGIRHDKNAYGRGHATYRRMREALVALGYIVLVRKGYKDAITGEHVVSTYEVERFPEACHQPLKFKNVAPPRIVTVRDVKAKFQKEGNGKGGGLLSDQQCRQRFGEAFDQEEFRLRNLASYLEQHPLVMEGDTFTGFSRRFNNNRMDRGGRIYTGYSSRKKELVNPETGEIFFPRQSATIDDEKVALIDVSGSFLCVCAGMNGYKIDKDEDPYGKLPFVVDAESRRFAKSLVSAMIASGGNKHRYTKKMREDFSTITGTNKIKVFTSAVHQCFPFLREGIDGLEVMFIESEIMLRTLERCVAEGVPAWPLHDAVFVKVSDVEAAMAILSEEFEKVLGFLPRLSVDYTHDKSNS